MKNTFPAWTTPNNKGSGRPGKLENLKTDLGEKINVQKENPKVMVRMKQLAAQAVTQLGNAAKPGTKPREAMTLDSSKPMVLSKR
mgnify:CR=1 FL=1